jgi:hypothetical protein
VLAGGAEKGRGSPTHFTHCAPSPRTKQGKEERRMKLTRRDFVKLGLALPVIAIPSLNTSVVQRKSPLTTIEAQDNVDWSMHRFGWALHDYIRTDDLGRLDEYEDLEPRELTEQMKVELVEVADKLMQLCEHFREATPERLRYEDGIRVKVRDKRRI